MAGGLDTQTQGAGPDVVLVHGALGDRRQWDAIASDLAARFRVHAVSRRFHWPHPMPAPDTRYTYEIHRDDLVGMLAAFEGPAHLVGHSYGAGVALMAALQAPQHVRSLTLIEPALGSLLPASAPGLEEERASRLASVEEVRGLIQAGRVERAAELFVDWLQGEAGGFSRLSSRNQAILLANAETLGPTMATPQPDVTLAHAGLLRLAVLVLNGELSRPWYRLIGASVAAAIQDATTGIVPGCAHMTIVENPTGTTALLRAFLERN